MYVLKMCAICKDYCFSNFLLVLFFAIGSESLIWNLSSTSLVFGENVELTCSGSACQPNTIKKWIGGPGYKLLCYKGYSSDSAKYSIMVNDTTADFGLMIKKFAVYDTYCSYTCACGLHQYTETLDLEGVDYICRTLQQGQYKLCFNDPPDIHANITMERDGKYEIDFQLDVYPFPTFLMTYEGSVIPLNITRTPKKEVELLLYNVSIIHTMEMSDYTCKGEILLTCNVGKRNYTLIRQSIDVCKETIDTNGNSVIPIIIIAVAFPFITSGIIIMTTYICVKQKHTKDRELPEHEESTEHEDSLIEENENANRNI